MPKTFGSPKATIYVRKEVKDTIDNLAIEQGLNKIDLISAILADFAMKDLASRNKLVQQGAKFVKQLESGLELEIIKQVERDRVKFTDEHYP